MQTYLNFSKWSAEQLPELQMSRVDLHWLWIYVQLTERLSLIVPWRKYFWFVIFIIEVLLGLFKKKLITA